MDFLKNIFIRIISVFLTFLFFGIVISTFSFIGNLFSNESSPKKERKKEIKKEIETEFDEIVHLSLENMSDFEESDIHTEQFLNSFNSLKKHPSKK